MTEPRSIELNYSGTFTGVGLSLWLRTGDLSESILQRFGRWQVRPGDLRIESSSGNPGDFLLVVNLLDYSVVARYRVESVELWTRNMDVAADEELQRALVGAAVQSVRSIVPQSVLSRQSISSYTGFELSPGKVPELIRGFHRASVDGVFVMEPAIAGFLVDLGQGARAVIELQRSFNLADEANGFIRILSTYPDTYDEEAACRIAAKCFSDSVTRLGLAALGEP